MNLPFGCDALVKKKKKQEIEAKKTVNIHAIDVMLLLDVLTIFLIEPNKQTMLMPL